MEQLPNDDDKLKDQIAELLKKENVDQQAIDEARAAVGDDPEKIKEYLINNRGL